MWDCGPCAGWNPGPNIALGIGPDVCGRADVASLPPEEFGGDTPPHERGSVLFWRHHWWERGAYDAAQAELARVSGGGGKGGSGSSGSSGGGGGSSGFSCELQAQWGKCGEAWMAGKCDRSCGRCGGGDGCTDVAP